VPIVVAAPNRSNTDTRTQVKRANRGEYRIPENRHDFAGDPFRGSGKRRKRIGFAGAPGPPPWATSTRPAGRAGEATTHNKSGWPGGRRCMRCQRSERRRPSIPRTARNNGTGTRRMTTNRARTRFFAARGDLETSLHTTTRRRWLRLLGVSQVLAEADGKMFSTSTMASSRRFAHRHC